MTEQQIAVSQADAGIIAGRMQEHNAAMAQVQQTGRALADVLHFFRAAHDLPAEAEVVGVDPEEGWVRVKVPELEDAG